MRKVEKLEAKSADKKAGWSVQQRVDCSVFQKVERMAEMLAVNSVVHSASNLVG